MTHIYVVLGLLENITLRFLELIPAVLNNSQFGFTVQKIIYRCLTLADINSQREIILNCTLLLKRWHFTDTTFIIMFCLEAKMPSGQKSQPQLFSNIKKFW